MKSSLRIERAIVHDGTGAEPRAATVDVKDGIIVRVGDDGEALAAPTTTIDGSGRSLVPGLIDNHFHAYGVSVRPALIEAAPMSFVALSAANRLRRALRRGFTTVRDVAGGDAGLARAVRDGLLPSPRYFYTGAALSQTGGHGDARDGFSSEAGCCGVMCERVDGVDAIRYAVRDRFLHGAHAIKIFTSGGVVSETDPLHLSQYSPEEIRAACDEAARRGSYVTAHAYSPEAISHAVRNGVRCIEHGNLLDEPTAALLARESVPLVPTLAAYAALASDGPALGLSEASQAKNAGVLAAGGESIAIARAAGVAIGFGTDLMGELERFQLDGLRLQCEALGVRETIRSATSVNADILGRQDLGRIRPGAAGDLLLLDGDLDADETLLWRDNVPRTVVQAGSIVAAPEAHEAHPRG